MLAMLQILEVEGELSPGLYLVSPDSLSSSTSLELRESCSYSETGFTAAMVWGVTLGGGAEEDSEEAGVRVDNLLVSSLRVVCSGSPSRRVHFWTPDSVPKL